MYKPFQYILFAFFSTYFPSILSSQVTGPQGGLIVIGKVDTIFSESLGEDREIWVSVPQSGRVPGKKFPVMYLLDGDAHFYSMMGTLHQLSTVNGNTICPEMVLVGILNTDRTRDLTPTHINEAFGDSVDLRSSGGLDKFTTFIEKELMPYIQSNYPVSSYKSYVGHSLGGLAVLHTFLTRPALFNAYIAIDPSLWWDNGLVNTMLDSLDHATKYDHASLYVGMANTLPEGMNMYEAPKDTTKATEHQRAIIEFCRNVDGHREEPGYKFKWKYYEQEDHSTVPMRAEFDGLRYLFTWYTLDQRKIEKFMEPGSTLTVKEFEDLIIGHYANVSDNFGYKVLPEETKINSLGYQFLETDRKDLAFACFNMNIINFPKSGNVYDSMGDYYVEIGDDKKAIEFFKKAVEVENLSYSKEKLEALKK